MIIQAYLLRSESRRKLDRGMERSMGPMSGDCGRLPIVWKGLGWIPDLQFDRDLIQQGGVVKNRAVVSGG